MLRPLLSIGCSQYECSNGQVFKSKKELVCVPKTKCKPVCLKIGNITYHEGDMMEYDDCHSWYKVNLIENVQFKNQIFLRREHHYLNILIVAQCK